MRKKKYVQYKIIVLCMFLLVYTQPLYAYLDPGTGSMLLAVIVGIVSTLIFIIRSMWYKTLIMLRGIFSKKNNTDGAIHVASFQSIVFYSEGGQYWNTFAPILQEFHTKGVNCTYISSDTEDPGLKFESDMVQKKYIGKGDKAFFHLNLLKADLCCLTTPNLDVLQIRRSKQVKHYAHIIHAPTDLHLYKLFAFDFYDSLLLSGPHQEKSLRHLESVRNTKKKQSYLVGCTYMDELWKRKEFILAEQHKKSTTDNTVTVLIAPTWGQSSLLNIYGEAMLKSLIDNNYTIIVRPHPQSLIVELDTIQYLQHTFKDYKNIIWDLKSDNFESLQNADILISDRSGIIFDFAFIFEKPVITHNTHPVLLGMEGNDIPWNAWELDIIDKLGATVKSDELHTLPMLINSTIASQQQYIPLIQSLRKEYVYNIGNAGKKSADVLIDIAGQVA